MTLREDPYAKTIAQPDAATDALSATIAADSGTGAMSLGNTLKSTTRPAVLPRIEGGKLPEDSGERYAKKRVLGAGGMGEVVLAEDRDIGRDVALKYLTAPSHDTAALARFTDEIRVVGSLEHPNIVPIHDVGVDENDRYYFVMKHVEGETLEQIIEKLQAADPQYLARYTFTVRIQIFVALLRALEFAHARGYVHRDIKPANVMVGSFGEVMLMDWGVAKRRKDAESVEAEAEGDENAKPVRERLFTTRRGAIVGTPAYMSPEQARGDVDAIDERSDVYCASVLFYELVTLRYYLGAPQTLPALIHAIQQDMPDFAFHAMRGAQGSPAAELAHFVKKGLQKDPVARYQNVTEMIAILEAALDGRCKVQCPFTLQKRLTRELSRLADRHPIALMQTLLWGSIGTITLVTWALYVTLHSHP